MKRQPKMRTLGHTRLNLAQEKYYRPFIDGYIKVLQSKLKLVKHIGHNYSYTPYICAEPNDRRNPKWRPFRWLWNYCEQAGYDFYVVLDIVFERLGRKLACECEMLRDDETCRRVELEKFLELILADLEKGNWSWFSFLFGLHFEVGVCVYCVC